MNKHKKYYEKNKEKHRNRYSANKDVYRDTSFQVKYGITLEQYNTLLLKQNHCCAICCRHESEYSKRLSVDHCHKTGNIRGLLCTLCNTGLGVFKDDITNLASAISYLNDKGTA